MYPNSSEETRVLLNMSTVLTRPGQISCVLIVAAFLPTTPKTWVNHSKVGQFSGSYRVFTVLVWEWPYLALQWAFMCSFSSGVVSNSILQALQVCTRLFASSCRCSSMCMASWLCSVNSSPHSEQMRFWKRNISKPLLLKRTGATFYISPQMTSSSGTYVTFASQKCIIVSKLKCIKIISTRKG